MSKRFKASGKHTTCGEEHHVIRRTITVDDANNRFINILRARLLEKSDMEVDFTTAVNMLLALARIRWNNEAKFTEEENKMLNRYTSGTPELQIEALSDAQQDKWLKYQLPKIMKRLEELSVQQRESDALTEAKPGQAERREAASGG
ncbi:MAG: hypothetical protein ACREBU_04880 [Nitrososphaera sp.]